MKNRNVVWLTVGYLTPFVLAIAFTLNGCERDKTVTYVVEGGYETIDGEYRVEMTEMEDTCNPNEPLDEPWWDMMEVVVQKKEEGTYLADILISNEVYLPEVKVEPDGAVNYEYSDGWGMNYLLNDGKLTPQEVDATLTLQVLDWYGEVVCSVTYEMEGYKLYVNAPPPEGTDR